MRMPLDRQSGVPLYRQIEDYLRQGIVSGSLAGETRLPATRQLAADLGVNRITVETAYSELEVEGLVYSRTGSGTYVLSAPALPAIPRSDPSAPWPLWQQEIRPVDGTLRRIMPQEMLKEAARRAPLAPAINLAAGVSDSHLFPHEEFRKMIQAVLRRDGAAALECGEVRGYAPLRETIAHVLASQGLQTRSDNILITAGSQQGLALVAQLLLRPGDVVLVEKPSYPGALALFRSMQLKIVDLPVDEHGLQTDRLEKRLQQHHPRLIYTIPNFHNPTGACLTSFRRRQLIALADRYNVPILEDDFVGDLRYQGRAQPALKALDPGGRIIYAGTFSKMLMPGLRVGFLVADGPVCDSLADFKCVQDLMTSTLIQRALEAFVTVGRYQAHLRRSCRLYAKRRDAMLQAIARFLPAGVRVTPPQGGLFLWLSLPGNLSAEALLPLAFEQGVAFTPGTVFFVDPEEGRSSLRLNFAANPPEMIEEGIRRLGRAIKRLR